MKTIKMIFALMMACAAVLGLAPASHAQTNAALKKVLVVSVTKSYRHAPQIASGLALLPELAKQSGKFDLDYVASDADMASKMTADALKNYDGVVFLCTTGKLPLPDETAFLDWVKSGKGFVGIHSSTDTLHGPRGGPPSPYIDMVGAEFVSHVDTTVDCIIDDPKHPADAKFTGKTWTIKDEIYRQINFDRTKMHVLISLDKNPANGQPTFMPLAWCKKYGQGNVFITALGHENAVWQSQEYHDHLLGGILWSLGLEPGDATPQATATATP